MNMAFSMTTRQFLDQTKDVTRRAGWRHIKLGHIHQAIEKGQGLKRGEKVVLLGKFIPVSSRWEPLSKLLDDPEYGKREVVREGFPDLTPAAFVAMLCEKYHCTPARKLNRIEFKHIEDLP